MIKPSVSIVVLFAALFVFASAATAQTTCTAQDPYSGESVWVLDPGCSAAALPLQGLDGDALLGVMATTDGHPVDLRVRTSGGVEATGCSGFSHRAVCDSQGCEATVRVSGARPYAPQWVCLGTSTTAPDTVDIEVLGAVEPGARVLIKALDVRAAGTLRAGAPALALGNARLLELACGPACELQIHPDIAPPYGDTVARSLSSASSRPLDIYASRVDPTTVVRSMEWDGFAGGAVRVEPDDGPVGQRATTELLWVGASHSSSEPVLVEPAHNHAPGVHPALIETQQAVQGCAGDPSCTGLLLWDRPWLDEAWTSALELIVDVPPGSAATILADISLIPGLEELEPAAIVVEAATETAVARGRLGPTELAQLQTHADTAGWVYRTRPLPVHDTTRLAFDLSVVGAAIELLGCQGSVLCVEGLMSELPDLITDAGRLLLAVEGAPYALSDVAGWSHPQWEVLTIDGSVAVALATPVALHDLAGSPLFSSAALTFVWADASDPGVSLDGLIAGFGDGFDGLGDPTLPPIGDVDVGGDDDDIIGDDDDIIGDDDDSTLVPPPDPPVLIPLMPNAVSIIEAQRPLCFDASLPARHGWLETTTLPPTGTPGWGDGWTGAGSPMWDPDFVNGFLGDTTPTRSVLEDYYACRDATLPMAWCPPLPGSYDLYTLARGYTASPGTVTVPLLVGSVPVPDAATAELQLTAPLILLASLSETTASSGISRWRDRTTFEIDLVVRAHPMQGTITVRDTDLAVIDDFTFTTDGSVAEVPCTVQIGLASDPMWMGAGQPPGPVPSTVLSLSEQLDVSVSCQPFDLTWQSDLNAAFTLSELLLPDVELPDPPWTSAIWQPTVHTLTGGVVGTALEALSLAASLEQFLGPYLFAVNDVFGCPGIYSPCTVPVGAGGPVSGYWTNEGVTAPSIRALMPAEPTLEAMDFGCTPAPWRENSGLAAVLAVEPTVPIGGLDGGVLPPVSTAGTFGVYELFQTLTGSALLTDRLDEFRELSRPDHPFAGNTGLLPLVSTAFDSALGLVAHQDFTPSTGFSGETCDERYTTVFGDFGFDAGECEFECDILDPSASLGGIVNDQGAMFDLGNLLGATQNQLPPLLFALHQQCKAECVTREESLRRQWMSSCSDTSLNPYEEMPFTEGTCEALTDEDADGRHDDFEYCIGTAQDTCAQGPFHWELVNVAPLGDPVQPEVRVYQAEWEYRDGRCRKSNLNVPVDFFLGGAIYMFSDSTSQSLFDPDGDGFPNHIDPQSGCATCAPSGTACTAKLDGASSFEEDLCDDSHLRVSKVLSLGDDPDTAAVEGVFGVPLLVFLGAIVATNSPPVISHLTQVVGTLPWMQQPNPPMPIPLPNLTPPYWPPTLPPLELFDPWLEAGAAGIPEGFVQPCVRFNVEGASLSGLSLSDGIDDPDPRLVLAVGGLGDPYDPSQLEFDGFVPAIEVRDDLLLTATASIDLQVDLQPLPAPGTNSSVTCDGSITDAPGDGVIEYSVTITDLAFTVPLAVTWTFPFAEDRRWEWAEAWRQRNSEGPGLDDFLTSLIQGQTLDQQIGLSAVGLRVEATDVQIEAPPRVPLGPLCDPFDPGWAPWCDMERTCWDAQDEDMDGFTDCADSDCAGAPACWMAFDVPAGYDPLAGYLLNVLLKPADGLPGVPAPLPGAPPPTPTRIEDFLGAFVGMDGDLDVLSQLKGPILDGLARQGGALFDVSLPYGDSLSFWGILQEPSLRLLGSVDDTALMPPLLRGLPGAWSALSGALGLPQSSLPLSSVGLDSFLGPELRVFLSQGGSVSEPGVLQQVLEGVKPDQSIALPRQQLHDDLWLAILADPMGPGGWPSGSDRWIYAGSRITPPWWGPIPEDWDPSASSWDSSAWTGNVLMAFYDFATSPLTAPSGSLDSGAWRAVPLPVPTPGASGW